MQLLLMRLLAADRVTQRHLPDREVERLGLPLQQSLPFQPGGDPLFDRLVVQRRPVGVKQRPRCLLRLEE
jgi:hypothetical protein